MSTYTREVTTASTDALVGRLLDRRYRVVERLAEGGMASVYLGVDTRLERDVAIKVMRPHLAHDDAFVARFHREARSAARLSHPGVVSVFDQGEDGGVVFLVMEYVPGQTLREILVAEGSLSPRTALDIMTAVLDALAAAHRVGIIHRDVKPENVIVRDDGTVKVADFGLARAVTSQTVTGNTDLLLGTVAYLSPEQVERGIADARSDVYAAGLMLFEMLTGTKAFEGDTAINIAWQHVHDGVPAPSSRVLGVPRVLDDLVTRASARDPDERPADAGRLLAELREAHARLDDRALDARPQAGPATSLAVREPTRRMPVGSAPTGSAPAWSTPTTPVGAVLSTGPHASPPLPPPGRRRRRWPWLLLVLLTVAGGALAWFFLLGPGALERVPVTARASFDRAVSTLGARHLDTARREVFSEDVAKGVVISSTPAAGAEVHRGSVVTLVVSKGKERYAVPPLAGLSLTEAKARLARVYLAVGDVTERFDEKVPAGQVISTSPQPATSLKRGAAVDLRLSKGREPVAVPNVRGRTLERATAELRQSGLTLRVQAERNDDRVPKGAVISQDPMRGVLYRGDAVSVVVSKGPVMVEVPDVMSMQVGQARALLESRGFAVEVEELFGGVFGTVRFQDPAGGLAPRGSTVVLQVV